MAEQQEEMGPVDIAVIGFPPGAPMTGEAVPLLMDLIDRGIVRVLDVMFVTKDESGKVGGFDASDLDSKGVGDFRAFEGASSGVLGDDDMVTAAEALEPGSAAVMLVYENRWAAPFANAVRRNGGELLAIQRIPIEEVAAALDVAEAAT
jgi:dihydroorotase-like cyclic amidohydrolase